MRSARGLGVVALWVGAAVCAGAQGPVFDVVSVRPSGPKTAQHANVPLDAGNVYSTLSAEDNRTAAGGYFVATHQPLWRYISFAYKLSGTQELALRFRCFRACRSRVRRSG